MRNIDKALRVVLALIDTAHRTTDLENVYNDSDGESFSWGEVHSAVVTLRQIQMGQRIELHAEDFDSPRDWGGLLLQLGVIEKDGTKGVVSFEDFSDELEGRAKLYNRVSFSLPQNIQADFAEGLA